MAANAKATGNDLDNALVENAGGDVLAGMGGPHYLTGGEWVMRFIL